jgi:hypothetical protein
MFAVVLARDRLAADVLIAPIPANRPLTLPGDAGIHLFQLGGVHGPLRFGQIPPAQLILDDPRRRRLARVKIKEPELTGEAVPLANLVTVMAVE